jgi:hypothetical protein
MENQYAAENAVIAIRVSSVKQGTDGDSPEAQKELIERFTQNHGIVVKKTFIFLESASKDVQPVQEAIDYCKDPKNDIQLFIIKSIDRFTRGGSFSYDFLKMQLEKYGVKLVDIYGIIGSKKINTLDNLGVSYKWSVYSPTQKSEILEAERAKDEIRDIMSRMIGAEIRYARLGYWVRNSPFGYASEKIETMNGKRCILKPHPSEASFIIKMFELRCRGTLGDREILDEINQMGFKTRVNLIRSNQDRTIITAEKGGNQLTLKGLWRYIQNPVYAGINSETWTQDKPVKCKFDGLVSLQTFNKANRGKIILSIKKGEATITRRKPPEYLLRKRAINPDFPYKQHVSCPHCAKPLYGSASRGKLGKYYPAYHCSHRGHNFRVPKPEFDQTIAKFVECIKVTPEGVDELMALVETEWNRRQVELHKDDINIDTKISELKTQEKLIFDKMRILTSETAIKYMEEDVVRIDDEIAILESDKSHMVDNKPINIKKVTAYIKYFLEHLEYLVLQQMNSITKAAFFEVLFDETPTYRDISSGTQDLTEITGLNRLFTFARKGEVNLAGEKGLEPLLPGPKPGVLPLDDSPVT